MISVRKLLMFFCVAAVVLAALTPLSAGLLWAFLVPILFLVGTLPFVWSERLPQESGAPTRSCIPVIGSRAPPITASLI
jgi:hypothetical protein